VLCTQLPTNGNGGEGLSGRKRKKNNNGSEDNIAQTMREVGKLLATNLITASDNLSKTVTRTVALENRLKVNDDLSKIIGLSVDDRLKARRSIVCQHEVIDLFFSIPNDDKEELVCGIINDAWTIVKNQLFLVYIYVFFFSNFFLKKKKKSRTGARPLIFGWYGW
jgi:hypothetical protein